MTWVNPAAGPAFPPLLVGRCTVPGLRARDEAVAGAGSGALLAGDVLWENDPTRVALAIVLQPEVALRQAAQMLPLAMVALADCIGSLAPPQVGVMFRWPGTVTVNGAKVGDVRVVSSDGEAGAVPNWLVVSVDLRMQPEADADEPGKSPDQTTLSDEGCEELTYLDVMASFSKHFLAWVNIWEGEGFRPVHKNWIERVEDRTMPRRLAGAEAVVTVRGMDEDGNLLVASNEGIVSALRLVDTVELADPQGEG